MRSLLLASAAALGLVGCETTRAVQSADLSGSAPPGGTLQAAYALPASVLVVTLKPAGGADGGGGDKPAPAGVTVNNTVTVTSPAPAAKPEPKPDPKKPETPAPPKCADLASAYDTARVAHATFIDDDTNRLKALERLANHEPFTAADVKAATAGMAELTKLREAEAAALDKALALGKQYAARCSALSVEVAHEIAPDRKHLYGLYVQASDYAATNVVTKVGEDGLLSEVTTTIDDKTADIAVSAVKSLVSLIYLADPGALGPQLSADQLAGATAAAAGRAAALAADTPKNRLLKFIALAEQSPLGELPRLETPPKEPQRYDLSELLSKPLHVIWREPRRDLLLGVECDDAKGTSLPGGTYDGVLVSLPRSCRAKVIEHPTGGRDLVLADVRFAAQDSGAALVLPVERTRFIARKTTYAFSKGRLTQTTYDRPSSALAAASLPADIVMGAVNQLSLAIQGRKGVSQAEADRLNAQANIYTAQSALIKARTEAKAAAAKETEPATPAPAAP